MSEFSSSFDNRLPAQYRPYDAVQPRWDNPTTGGQYDTPPTPLSPPERDPISAPDRRGRRGDVEAMAPTPPPPKPIPPTSQSERSETPQPPGPTAATSPASASPDGGTVEPKIVLREKHTAVEPAPPPRETSEAPQAAEKHDTRHSQEAAAAIRQEYVNNAVAAGQFKDTGSAEIALNEREEAIRSNHALTINMSPESVKRLAAAGKVETYWDHVKASGGNVEDMRSGGTTNGKALGDDDYETRRRVADDGLRIHAPANTTREEPIFGAIASPEQLTTGAAPEYGNWHVTLDPTVEAEAVYNFGDSYRLVDDEGGQFSFDDSGTLNRPEDAITAKAITDLVQEHHASLGYRQVGGLIMDPDFEKLIDINGHRPPYVEAAMFNDVPLDRIATVHANLETPEHLAGAGDILGNPPEAIQDKLRVDCGRDVEPLTKSWVERRYKGERPTAKSNPEADDKAAAAWEELGLNPDATFDEVADALQERIGQLWKPLMRAAYGIQGAANHRTPETFHSPGQWHNYQVRMNQQVNGSTSRLNDSQKASLAQLLRFQQAKVFFTKKPTAAANE